MNRTKLMLGLLVSASIGATSAFAQDDDYTIRLVAGSPGDDHIQPFMAEYMDIWEKYGLNVDFMGGNYMRSNQMMSIGDFDVGYNQYASAIRFNAAGIDNLIVAASSANCALIVAHEDVNSWEDLKGKRFGINDYQQSVGLFGMEEKRVRMGAGNEFLPCLVQSLHFFIHRVYGQRYVMQSLAVLLQVTLHSCACLEI
jgi:ABC-type nitrate/sulfonate/bicarbonate transport system substrate-binding protein